MSQKIVTPLNVIVKPTSWCAYWSIHGLRPHYSEQLHFYSEEGKDLYPTVKLFTRVDYTAELFTRGYFNHLPQLKDDSMVGYYKDNAIFTSKSFGRTLEQMSKEKKMIYTPGVIPDKPSFHELEYKGEKVSIINPTRFGIFHPTYYITKKSLETAIVQFLRDFRKATSAFVSVKIFDYPYEDVWKSFQEQLELEQHVKEMKEQGRSWKIEISPVAAEKIFEEELSDLEGELEKVVSNEQGVPIAILKDGTKIRIGKPLLKAVK